MEMNKQFLQFLDSLIHSKNFNFRYRLKLKFRPKEKIYAAVFDERRINELINNNFHEL